MSPSAGAVRVWPFWSVRAPEQLPPSKSPPARSKRRRPPVFCRVRRAGLVLAAAGDGGAVPLELDRPRRRQRRVLAHHRHGAVRVVEGVAAAHAARIGRRAPRGGGDDGREPHAHGPELLCWLRCREDVGLLHSESASSFGRFRLHASCTISFSQRCRRCGLVAPLGPEMRPGRFSIMRAAFTASGTLAYTSSNDADGPTHRAHGGELNAGESPGAAHRHFRERQVVGCSTHPSSRARVASTPSARRVAGARRVGPHTLTQ